MYVGLAISVEGIFRKLFKEDIILLGDIRGLSAISGEVYLVKKINGRAISSVREGVFYKTKDVEMDGPFNITDLDSLKTIMDLGLMSHEDENGEYNLLYDLVKVKGFSSDAFKWLYNSARSEGFLYDLNALKRLASDYSVRMHANSLVNM